MALGIAVDCRAMSELTAANSGNQRQGARINRRVQQSAGTSRSNRTCLDLRVIDFSSRLYRGSNAPCGRVEMAILLERGSPHQSGTSKSRRVQTQPARKTLSARGLAPAGPVVTTNTPRSGGASKTKLVLHVRRDCATGKGRQCCGQFRVVSFVFSLASCPAQSRKVDVALRSQEVS